MMIRWTRPSPEPGPTGVVAKTQQQPRQAARPYERLVVGCVSSHPKTSCVSIHGRHGLNAREHNAQRR